MTALQEGGLKRNETKMGNHTPETEAATCSFCEEEITEDHDLAYCAEQEENWEKFLDDEGRLWLVFLAYKAMERRPRALFAMSHRDSRAFTMDVRTKGRGWMACHTRLENWEVKGKVPARVKIKDTGQLDHVIEELGLTKIAI